jgi:hypothetical protein
MTGLHCPPLAATLTQFVASMSLVCAICHDRDYWLYTDCIVGMYWEFARFALLYWIEITYHTVFLLPLDNVNTVTPIRQPGSHMNAIPSLIKHMNMHTGLDLLSRNDSAMEAKVYA